jgi:hypothetical protein
VKVNTNKIKKEKRIEMHGEFLFSHPIPNEHPIKRHISVRF